MRVNHDLLRAGAMCKVSNALGFSEKHIQLLGKFQALPSVPGTQRHVSHPCTGTVRAVLLWLSSVSLPPFLLYQWSPSEKVSPLTAPGVRERCLLAVVLHLTAPLPPPSLGDSVSACFCSGVEAACFASACRPTRPPSAASCSPGLPGTKAKGWPDVLQETL